VAADGLLASMMNEWRQMAQPNCWNQGLASCNGGEGSNSGMILTMEKASAEQPVKVTKGNALLSCQKTAARESSIYTAEDTCVRDIVAMGDEDQPKEASMRNSLRQIQTER